MHTDTFKKIEKFVKFNLSRSLHSRHFEDCVQYIAMKFWESGLKGNFRWYLVDYLRENGIGHDRHVRPSARAIENQTWNNINIEQVETDVYIDVKSSDGYFWILKAMNCEQGVCEWGARTLSVNLKL